MVKKIIIPIVAALVAVIVAVGAAVVVRNSQFGMWYEGFNGKYRVQNYMMSNYYGDGIDLARNKRELNDLVGDKYDDKYNDAFFITRAVIIIEFWFIGEAEFELKDVYRKENEIIVELYRDINGQFTKPTCSTRFMIAVSKLDLIGVNKVTKVIVE